MSFFRSTFLALRKNCTSSFTSLNKRFIATVGSPAPQFSSTAVVNRKFCPLSLDDYKGDWLLLFFYPLDFTFVCPTEITQFSDSSNEFKKLNCHVVGVSCDSHFSHLAWIEQSRNEGGLGNDLQIPLISDLTKSISSDYGCLNEEKGFPMRGTYLIDPTGIIRHISINDAPVGRNVEEYIRLVNAFQFTDKYGQVCPANWNKAGDPTIKPNPKEKLEYFNQTKKAN